MLVSGAKIGRYIVRRKLAEGGMAEIYLCAALGPEGFEKEVVIKVVRSFLARDDAFMKMFIDEARLASRLNHANVVQIFDFAKHDESYFIAMEFVKGVSLWDLRRRCRELGVTFPSTLVAEIGMHVARGLHYAHSLTERGRPIGVVHRDVTPHNVLLSYDGGVKLTDFGIAKASGNQSSTAAGMLKGKFAYMSPEQARGEKIDARTDLFALGIVIWEMLTGGRLFEGDSDVAVLRAVQQSYISPPARLNPDVPPELDALVMKALERDVDKRFQSAQEMERALANFVLRHAKSVEDTNVGMFVSQMFRDELEELKAAEYEEKDGTKSTAKEPPADSVSMGATAVVQRDHSKPRESAPRPEEKPKTALLPGTRPRGPLEDEDDGNEQRTDQMREFDQQPVPGRPATAEMATPGGSSPVVLRDSFLKEVADASRQLQDEEKQHTTESVPRTSAPKPQLEASVLAPSPVAPQKSMVPWVLTSLLAAGFIGGLGYMLMFKPPVEQSVMTAPPPPKVDKPIEVAQVPEPAPAPPVPAAAAEPEPKKPEEAPAVVADEKPEPIEKPAEKADAPAMGTLEITATPWAHLTINGKAYPDVQGLTKIPLRQGRYVLVFDHPQRHNVTFPVNITAKKSTPVVFKAISP